MPKLPPFNIQIMDVDDFIQRHSLLPVNSPNIFELGTRRFHPDGLFSEVIFGAVGSRDRLVRKGFIDLRTDVITPHLYKQILTLKSFYQDVLAGKAYAYFDEKEKDLVLSDEEDLNADTGFSFFVRMLPKIQFKRSDSIVRNNKIALIDKYRERLIIDKLIVLPAGIRDVRMDDDYISPEEINKIYMAILSLREALPANKSEERLYDSIRYQIQQKLMEIYVYITTLIDGKHGFAQGKFAARRIQQGTRNVITALALTRVNDPLGPKGIRPDELMLPLFQAMKSCVPLMVNKLKSAFFDLIFSSQTNTIPLIDPDTKVLTYVDVDTATINKFTTADGINELINDYRAVEKHWEPASVPVKDAKGNIKNYWLYLVHDTGSVIRFFRNKDDMQDIYLRSMSEMDPTKCQYLDLIPENLIKDVLITYDSAYAIYSKGNFTNEKLDLVVRNATVAESFDSNENINVLIADNFDDFIKTEGIKIGKYWVTSPAQLVSEYGFSGTEMTKSRIPALELLSFSNQYIRPMTWTEMFYVATDAATAGRTATATRHPMMNIENISLNKLRIMSTAESREVRCVMPAGEVVLPEYPIINAEVKTPLSVHPSHLERYGGK